ncbi:MAG: DegT/DnrJ/EryC1/StrS family aminotransferase [Candidatus Brocadiaceae bacterium]|nr:DegT/DnrJ/EryC1/StrS family aminotransferase [Candidatus Brocadiaceae bacterium]
MPGPGAFWIGEEEKREVNEVLDSGYVFRYGNLKDPRFKAKVYSLEQEVARHCGVKYAVATSSGTSALLISLQALGIGPGDEVICPAYTFVASYTSVIAAGGLPVLAEIDESLTLDPEDVQRRITPKTKAIMPVHMLGNPSNMDALMDVADRAGLPVLEDACQSVGASYKGRKTGAIGKIGAFSLNFFKTVTAGDGGVAITDDEDLYERAFGFHDQGHTPNRAGVEVGHRQILGLDFRMNELTGAMALAQYRKVDRILSTLRSQKARLREAIGEVPGMHYRTVYDPDGECGTLLVAVFDSAERAADVAAKIGSKTVNGSGWHVYYNMEHVMHYLAERGRPHGRGAYPRTDDILSRSLALSVGVVDAGLGAGAGININSTDEEIRQCADAFRTACGV